MSVVKIKDKTFKTSIPEAEIKKRVKLRGFINTSYDYCTGSHVGPDTIALFFMAKDRELGA